MWKEERTYMGGKEGQVGRSLKHEKTVGILVHSGYVKFIIFGDFFKGHSCGLKIAQLVMNATFQLVQVRPGHGVESSKGVERSLVLFQVQLTLQLVKVEQLERRKRSLNRRPRDSC